MAEFTSSSRATATNPETSELNDFELQLQMRNEPENLDTNATRPRSGDQMGVPEKGSAIKPIASPLDGSNISSYVDPMLPLLQLAVFGDTRFCDWKGTTNAIADMGKRWDGVNERFGADYVARFTEGNGYRCINWIGLDYSNADSLLESFGTWCRTVDSTCGFNDLALMLTKDCLGTPCGAAQFPNVPPTGVRVAWAAQNLGDHLKHILPKHEIGHTLFGTHQDADSWLSDCWQQGWYRYTIMFGTLSEYCTVDWFSDRNKRAMLSEGFGRVPQQGRPRNVAQFFYGPATVGFGLELWRWEVQHPASQAAGSTATFLYGIYNNGPPITLANVYIRCRYHLPPTETLCDFGFQGPQTLGPGQWVYVYATKTLGNPGYYEFEPQYETCGSCYFTFLGQRVDVASVSLTVGFWGGPDVSDDGIGISAFTILAPRSPPRTGDMLVFQCHWENTNPYDIDLSPTGIFFGARNPAGENRDFGYQLVKMRAWRWTDLTATRIVDAPGNWRFWPAYYYDGGWGPFERDSLTVYVAS